MWARVSEVWLGAWLLVSPLVFRNTESVEAFAARDVVVGSIVVVLSLLSFWRPTAHAHLLTALLALGFGLAAYAVPRPGPPAAQNEIAVAMLLVLLAIVPNEASRPPRGWRGDPELRV
jgi:hypothetical protein